MASHTIYAPTVNSYEPACNCKDACIVYFILSDYNIRSDVEYVHASVVKASTNHNVVDTTRDSSSGSIFTNAGIILNLGIKVSGPPIIQRFDQQIYSSPFEVYGMPS